MGLGLGHAGRTALLALAMTAAAPAMAQMVEMSDEPIEDSGSQDDSYVSSSSALPGRPWYVSPMFSYTFMDSDRGLDDGIGGTISIGKKVTDGMALELTGYFTSADAESTAPATFNGDPTEIKGVGVNALINPLSSLPDLYAIVGLMYESASRHPGAISDYEGTTFDLGLAYLISLGDRVKIRAEGRYRTDAHDRKEAGVSPGNKHFQDAVVNLGLLLPLGSVIAPAEEPVEVVEAVEAVTAADSDGDGVPDDLDRCPDTPAGVVVGEDGCPLDSDGDGIPDYLDECPRSPAGAKVLANGCALTGDCRTPRAGEQVDENGCAVEQRFVLKGVKFEFDSDRLTPEAQSILNDVAGTLQAYPDVKVELQGHTDNIGSDAYNQGLSERRAIAVKTYLIGRDVASNRMNPVGYGESQPIATNDTEEGREENRRVELKVLD